MAQISKSKAWAAQRVGGWAWPENSLCGTDEFLLRVGSKFYTVHKFSKYFNGSPWIIFSHEMVKWQSATKIGPLQSQGFKKNISKYQPILYKATFCPPFFSNNTKIRLQKSWLKNFQTFLPKLQTSKFEDTMLGTNHRAFKWRSQALSKEIRDSGGAARAVELIQELMPRSKRATLQSKNGI